MCSSDLRLQEAVEAGADAFWFGTVDEGEMQKLKALLKKPGGGVLQGAMTSMEYQRRGSSFGVLPNAMSIAALVAQQAMLAGLKEHGSPQAWLSKQDASKACEGFYGKLGMDLI